MDLIKIWESTGFKISVEKMMNQDKDKRIERKKRTFGFRHRIFLCFVAIAIVPLLILGLYSDRKSVV